MKSLESNEIPKVSFIMGVYCCENIDGVLGSVESIILQTYKDWEFLIVDDGSPDNGRTFSILKAVADLDNRIIPLRYEKNRGLAYALNYCLRYAKGNYIARQDDDDYSDVLRLETQIDFLEKNPDIDIVGTQAILFDDKGDWGYLDVEERPTNRSFLWNSPFIHPSTVMRTDSLRAVGGYRVAKETRRGQDYDLFMRMYAAGMQGANITKPLYRYRSNRTTSKYKSIDKRFNEAQVRLKNFKALGIGPIRYLYIAKPIILSLIPKKIYGQIQKRRTKLS